MFRVRSRTACVSKSIGAPLWMGRHARGSRKTIALLEVRQEGLSDSSDRDSKATRGALGALAFHRILTQASRSMGSAHSAPRVCSVDHPLKALASSLETR